MTRTDKATKEALSYIENYFRTVFADCSDSMNECEYHEARFEVLTGDVVKIKDYIRTFLLNEYVEGWKAYVEEASLTIEDQKNPCVKTPIITYEEIKHLL